jgi:hypothetical protein
MRNLCKELCDTIEDRDDLSFSKVAEFIGASKQAMSKFKSEGVIGFRKLLRLSYLLYPNSQKETMADWCLRLCTVETIKHSFEYAAITRDIDLLNKLIKKHKYERSGIAEYVAVYSLIYDYMINEVHGSELISKLENSCKIKDESLRVLVDILRCYGYYFLKKFHTMIDVAQEAERKLKSLSDKRELFMKECFLHRIAEVLAPAFLHLNNLKLARYYAGLIINANICPKTVSDASYVVGMSFILEDQGKCIEYLQKSYDIAKTIGDSVIETETRFNLDFAKLYLNIKLDDTSDKILLNLEADRKSEVNLKAVEEVMYQKGEDDLITLFRACENGKKEILHECFFKFFQQSNFFFSSFVAKELKKLGDESVWADQMIKYTINVEESVSFEKGFISCFGNFRGSSWSCNY